MRESLDPVLLTPQIIHSIIGMVIKSDEFEDFQNLKEDELVMLHHTLGQEIRNRWIWKNSDEYDMMMHPDDLSYEWIVEAWKWVNQSHFDLQEFINQNPEALI